MVEFARLVYGEIELVWTSLLAESKDISKSFGGDYGNVLSFLSNSVCYDSGAHANSIDGSRVNWRYPRYFRAVRNPESLSDAFLLEHRHRILLGTW